MHRHLTAAVAALGLAAAIGLGPGHAQETVTVFEGARVITGDGRPPIANGAFVVTGDRFTQIGPSGRVKVPQGATRINLAGKTVMPTVVDTHTHLSQTREALIDDLRRRASFGVSGALSLGTDKGDVLFQIRSETIPGAARYFTAGRGITMPEPGRSDVPFWITTEAEGRAAVRELAAQQVDIVKIWVDDRDGKYKKLPPELYGAVIQEAHERGLRVTAHIFTLADAKGLLKAGIDAFAHGIRDTDVDAEVLKLFKARPKVVLVPNLPDRKSPGFAVQARNLAKLNAAGVRIAMGTDGNNAEAAHGEMEDMVAAGMTAAQVIVAATRHSAEFLKMADAGTIAARKSADFIVLNANPLDDITNTRKIAAVYLRGEKVDR
jgi:imidazolonepropionase-like amidohydrolase